jgi:translation initiation factor 4A
MALGDYMGASCHACIGGTNVRAEVQKLQMEAPHIIVGTPGRVFDMLNRRYLCEYCFLVPWVTFVHAFGFS